MAYCAIFHSFSAVMLQSWAKNEIKMHKSYIEQQRGSLLPKWNLVIFKASFFKLTAKISQKMLLHTKMYGIFLSENTNRVGYFTLLPLQWAS